MNVKKENIYIIKNLAPWMIDELIAFSQLTKFDIFFLRKQDTFFNEDINTLQSNGIEIHINPTSWNYLPKKIWIVLGFIFSNVFKFSPDYNFVLGFKSVLWFLRMDMSKFSPNSKIHAQFATQAAIISYLIYLFYKKQPEFSFTFHAYDIYFKNRWFNKLISNCKYAFSISDYNVKYVSEKYRSNNKIVLSRLGVFRDILKVSGKYQITRDPLKLGLISWFVEKKGIFYLLEAILKLKKEGFTNIQLILAGDGPLKEQIVKFVKDNELENMVNYIGKLRGNDKIRFFKDLDVFILPSITLDNDKDGIPVVLMEAIAASLPLISTDVSGIPEICLNDYNGLLIEEKNENAIVDAIISVYNNKEKLETFSKNSYALSKEYDIVENSRQKLALLDW